MTTDLIEHEGFKVHDVNLVAEYNIAGEIWSVLPLLDELGLRVLCSLFGDARFHAVQSMHRAEVNMMVCSKAMINVARKLKETSRATSKASRMSRRRCAMLRGLSTTRISPVAPRPSSPAMRPRSTRHSNPIGLERTIDRRAIRPGRMRSTASCETLPARWIGRGAARSA